MVKTQRSGTYALCATLIIIVLIIMSVALGSISIGRYDQYLSGLWVGNLAFLKKAGLRDFQLFIAPQEDGCRQGYLIITNEDGEFISNQAIEINVRPRPWSAIQAAFRTKKDTYKSQDFEIEYDDTESEKPMPESMNMTLSILDGTLTLYSDEKVYAFAEKDLIASTAAIAAYTT